LDSAQAEGNEGDERKGKPGKGKEDRDTPRETLSHAAIRTPFRERCLPQSLFKIAFFSDEHDGLGSQGRKPTLVYEFDPARLMAAPGLGTFRDTRRTFDAEGRSRIFDWQFMFHKVSSQSLPPQKRSGCTMASLQRVLRGLQHFFGLLQFRKLAFFFLQFLAQIVYLVFLFPICSRTTSTGVFFTQGFRPSFAPVAASAGRSGGTGVGMAGPCCSRDLPVVVFRSAIAFCSSS
jgi:hypothetical protein